MTHLRDPRVPMVYGLAREAGFEAGGHPAPERIFEYQEGLLTEEEKAEVQDHLSLCPDCTRTVLELSGTVEPELPEVPAPHARERTAALWPGLRRRLPFPDRAPAAYRSRRTLERIALPLAASFLLAALAASFWALSLFRENHRLTGPRANVAILDLVPLSEQGVHREEGRQADVPPEAEAVLLVLNLADLRPFPAYRGEITTEGRVLWSIEDLERSDRGNFTLHLPRPFSGSGRYRIRLFGVDAGDRELLAEYDVDLGDAP